LRDLQALPNTPDISANITLRRPHKPSLRLRISPVTFCIPYALAARWAEIAMHSVQGQRLSSKREGLIAGYCHHFWMVASWTSHNITSFFLKLDDRRLAISKTSNLDVNRNAVLCYAVVHILPLAPKSRPPRKAVIVKGRLPGSVTIAWITESK
jgi:hypothetical protein